jgi:hypothetical protein
MNVRVAVRRAALLTLVFGAGAAATTVGERILFAQAKPLELVKPGQKTPESEGKILSGDEVGFRFDHLDRDGAAVGTLMVKVNGRWADARFGGSMRRGSQ